MKFNELVELLEARTNDAFTKWFGRSVMVDNENKPKVVYHTTSVDFTEFDEGLIFDVPNARSGPGFYFTDKKGGGGGMRTGVEMEVFLCLENPAIISDDISEAFTPKQLDDIQLSSNDEAETSYSTFVKTDLWRGTIEQYGNSGYTIKSKSRGDMGWIESSTLTEYDLPIGLISLDTANKLAGLMVDGTLDAKYPNRLDKDETTVTFASYQKALYKALISAGYDGVIHEQGDGVTHYVALRSTQVKSVNNRGTWSSETGNIME